MRRSVLWLTLVLALRTFAYGSSFTLVTETDVDQPASLEVFGASYATRLDFLADFRATGGFSDIDINSAFDVGGFASDGDQYHLVLESNTDAPAGSEVFLITFDSLADFVADLPSAAGFTSIDINFTFSIRGFASDGDHYHLVLESNTDAPARSEVLLITFDSLADLVADLPASVGFSDIDINSAFSVGGLGSDSDQYHLVLESNADAPPGSEVFLITFDSLDDFVADSPTATDFSQINIDLASGIGGLAGGVPIFADGFETGNTSAWSSTVQVISP